MSLKIGLPRVIGCTYSDALILKFIMTKCLICLMKTRTDFRNLLTWSKILRKENFLWKTLEKSSLSRLKNALTSSSLVSSTEVMLWLKWITKARVVIRCTDWPLNLCRAISFTMNKATVKRTILKCWWVQCLLTPYSTLLILPGLKKPLFMKISSGVQEDCLQTTSNLPQTSSTWGWKKVSTSTNLCSFWRKWSLCGRLARQVMRHTFLLGILRWPKY